MKYSRYSVVIVGSGIAGLYLALKLSEQKQSNDGILLLTKTRLNESNSRLAQGGIVAVMPQNKTDSVALHVSDTIRAGGGLSDFNVAKFISQNSSYAIEDLLRFGVEFDQDSAGKLSFALEAAHSTSRILHAGKDATGECIERKLSENVIQSKDIDIYEQTMAVELLLDANGDCKGVLVYNSENDEYEAIYSNAVVLASGGIGQVYKHTTNPSVATADGIAMANSAGALIKNMEFVQFHPTALAVDSAQNMSLISEAVRGEGAVLETSDGESFMSKYDPRENLAPRDIAARAIFNEISSSDSTHVYLNIKDMGLDKFKQRFPNISKICQAANINLSDLRIPVAPAAHYSMGGIQTNVNGKTSVNNLYAVGEVACTGLHGANRLASNSLLECIVCSYELANLLSFKNLDAPKVFDEGVKSILDEYSQISDLQEVDTKSLVDRLKAAMWNNVAISRDEEGLNAALLEIYSIEREFGRTKKCLSKEEYELRNMLNVSKLITLAALRRRESVGAHYRTDYPPRDIFSDFTNLEDGEIVAK